MVYFDHARPAQNPWIQSGDMILGLAKLGSPHLQAQCFVATGPAASAKPGRRPAAAYLNGPGPRTAAANGRGSAGGRSSAPAARANVTGPGQWLAVWHKVSDRDSVAHSGCGLSDSDSMMMTRMMTDDLEPPRLPRVLQRGRRVWTRNLLALVYPSSVFRRHGVVRYPNSIFIEPEPRKPA